MISYALSESLLIYNFWLESDKIVKLVLLALYSYLSICGNFLRFVRSSLDAFSEFTCIGQLKLVIFVSNYRKMLLLQIQFS